MRNRCVAAVLALVGVFALVTRADEAKKESSVPPVLQFKMKSLAGDDVDLAKYQGKVILMVNTASKCGYTPQYKDLEALHEKYKDKGLVVLGFPANDFKQQEPGSDQDIAKFCEEKYGVTFDMFSKVVVTGEQKTPLYAYLTTNAPTTGEVKWNFEKFLIAKDGKVVGRYLSKVKPMSDELVGAIDAELAK